MADDETLSSDSVTETSSEGWLSRIGSAITGVIFGLVLFIAGFPLLFWNEGRAVTTAKSLAEGRGAVVTVPSDRVDAANEGKLVHTTGRAKTTETLADKDFDVSTNAIRLKRKVEMYQWKESSKSETKQKTGGGSETVTTYSYDKEWSSSPNDSSRFKQPSGHENPRAMKAAGAQWEASKVSLGAFTLSASQVASIGGEESLPVAAGAKIPAVLGSGAVVNGGGYYVGSDPQAPAVGDQRVSFSRVGETDLTVVAKQAGNSFEPYRASAGGNVDLQRQGIATADAMFTSAEESNVMLTWVLRGAGWLMLCIGIGLVLRPLSVLASVLPIVGDIIGAGTGMIAFLLGSVFAIITIAIAWIAFRPLLGIAILAVGGALAYGIVHLVRKARAARLNATLAPRPATAS